MKMATVQPHHFFVRMAYSALYHWYGGFYKWGLPAVIIYFNGMFPYKPTIFGYLQFWKPPDVGFMQDPQSSPWLSTRKVTVAFAADRSWHHIHAEGSRGSTTSWGPMAGWLMETPIVRNGGWLGVSPWLRKLSINLYIYIHRSADLILEGEYWATWNLMAMVIH